MSMVLHLSVVMGSIRIEGERRGTHRDRTIRSRACRSVESIETESHTTGISGVGVAMRAISITVRCVTVRCTVGATRTVNGRLGESRGKAKNVIAMGHIATVHGCTRLIGTVGTIGSGIAGVRWGSATANLEVRRRGVERTSIHGTV